MTSTGCMSAVQIRPTLSDVAQFAPGSVALVDEPDGVGIAGMPMNFVAAPTIHEQVGTLFDTELSVRFTPVAVRYDYGDGTVRTVAPGARTWAQLGLAQFSATPSSHAYRAGGRYVATAAVQYSADFNLGRGWVPIDGILTIPTGSAAIQIFEARTALVERTCLEDPTGPGC